MKFNKNIMLNILEIAIIFIQYVTQTCYSITNFIIISRCFLMFLAVLFGIYYVCEITDNINQQQESF